MPLSSNIIGMHYRYPDFYEVGREKVREYAVAVKISSRHGSGRTAVTEGKRKGSADIVGWHPRSGNVA